MHPSKFDDKALERLYEAILTLKDKQECSRFFQDLCTVSELQSLSQRVEVAEMLRNDMTYQEIARRTHASTVTIARVNRALEYGADGYALVFDRMENNTKE
jgi:TrpR-related protein YerC/YecD